MLALLVSRELSPRSWDPQVCARLATPGNPEIGLRVFERKMRYLSSARSRASSCRTHWCNEFPELTPRARGSAGRTEPQVGSVQQGRTSNPPPSARPNQLSNPINPFLCGIVLFEQDSIDVNHAQLNSKSKHFCFTFFGLLKSQYYPPCSGRGSPPTKIEGHRPKSSVPQTKDLPR